jgi:Putative protein-S-isoprenylcysteine methyltransferase
MVRLLLIVLSATPITTALVLFYHIKRNGFNIGGRIPIAAYIFYTSKATVTILFLALFTCSIYPDILLFIPIRLQDKVPLVQQFMSIPFLIGGNLLFISGCVSLGIFTRIGIPETTHFLQTSNVYQISRNPIYTGLIFFYTACFILLPSLITGALIIYCIVTHHLIIKKEEKYLTETFKEEYLNYKKQVARYL